MDNHIFRSAIGGFNRQDVMEYIERTQKQSEESISWLESQVEQTQRAESEAQRALQECQEERDRIAAELEEMTSRYNNAKKNWEAQAQAKESNRQDVVQRDQTIREMTEENQRLFHQIQELESDASNFRRQKEQLAQLELDAYKRADDLLTDATAKAKAITDAAELQARGIVAKATEHAAAIAKSARINIADTVDDFNEVLQVFEEVSEQISDKLQKLEHTVGELPVGLNLLKDDLYGLLDSAAQKEQQPEPKKMEPKKTEPQK
ncbi:MAG: DivIVA domain-containing protein [Oscillospiraceae bacterium]|nr:DivIVA domain-containing protein [Oscillospiraceae bacterium]